MTRMTYDLADRSFLYACKHAFNASPSEAEKWWRSDELIYGFLQKSGRCDDDKLPMVKRALTLFTYPDFVEAYQLSVMVHDYASGQQLAEMGALPPSENWPNKAVWLGWINLFIRILETPQPPQMLWNRYIEGMHCFAHPLNKKRPI